jgi:hypothetical protein
MAKLIGTLLVITLGLFLTLFPELIQRYQQHNIGFVERFLHFPHGKTFVDDPDYLWIVRLSGIAALAIGFIGLYQWLVRI